MTTLPQPADDLPTPARELNGYQLRVVREVLLALLAGEASHGYQLRARLALALGPLAEALNDGQVYVTLNRLEKAGLVTQRRVGQADRPDRKVYALTPAGRERVDTWLNDTSWPKPAPAEFHLKLVAAAAAGPGFGTLVAPPAVNADSLGSGAGFGTLARGGGASAAFLALARRP